MTRLSNECIHDRVKHNFLVNEETHVRLCEKCFEQYQEIGVKVRKEWS